MSDELFSQIFDHRPFLKNEVNYFKKEFQDKRKDREVEQLFKVLELITEIKDDQVPKIVTASDNNLPRTIADIQVALHMCDDTLAVEKKFNSNELLAKNRAGREKRLLNAEQDINEKLKLVDSSFRDREDDMRKYFMKQAEKRVQVS